MNTHEEFRNVIRSERENLTHLSDYWSAQTKCDTSMSKDLQGRIRAAVGKTRLLLSEKFKQFEGLVEQSENNTSEKEISINDLNGFWDLVLIQVNEVKEMFRSLDPLNERIIPDGRKSGRIKNQESDISEKETPKENRKSGFSAKKKSLGDQINQTQKSIEKN